MDQRLPEEIKKYIEEGIIKLGEPSLCAAFNDYIVREYSWIANHLQWDLVPGAVTFDLTDATHSTLRDFLHTTRLEKYFDIAWVYSINENCLFMPLEFYIANEGILMSRIHDLCYMVGVEYENGEPQLVQEDFIEYKFSGGFWLRGRKKDVD